ncbi:Tetraspanin family-domain-containing protein [Zopfochytrium polystomum]|nr:Tetraspanin family-domain-containing protein [Zopfochytrium polystomum]
MPFLSRITTFSFNKETFWTVGGFMIVKNLLLFINFLALLAGILLLAAGAYLQVSAPSTGDLIHLSTTIAAGSLGVGIVVVVVSFLGCFGAANEKGMLLKTYFGLLCALVVLELGVGGAAYAKRDAVVNVCFVADLVERQWEKLIADNTTASTNTILKIEHTFQCCGYRTPTTLSVPATDCPLALGYPNPCFSVLQDALRGSLSVIGGAGVGLGVVELVGIAFSALLFVRIARRERASESLLGEAWRINRDKIQYGYANYQYV